MEENDGVFLYGWLGQCASGQAPSTKTYGTLPYTMLRYAVTAPLRGACSFGVFAHVYHLFMQHRR